MAAAAAALLQIRNGQTMDELENNINQCVAKDVVKDFRQSSGPDHLSGKGSEKDGVMNNWIKYKKRLKGALRRANFSYTFLFTESQNVDLSITHLDVIPPGHSMNTLLFDVLELTTSDTALGIVGKFGGTMNGAGALKALDSKFITGSYKERSTVKTRILETEFGRDDPHEKLQDLETLMETRATQAGSYDDAERISDLICILKKTPEYSEFLRSHNFLVSTGMTMTCDQFVTAICDHWEDTICSDEPKKKKTANAGGAEGESEGNPSPSPGAKGKGGKNGKGTKGGKGGKGAKGGKKGGKGGNERWSSKGGQGQHYNQGGAHAGAAPHTGGGRGLPSTNQTDDDPRCTWSCPICGPMDPVNE